jgi:hypothetical protein
MKFDLHMHSNASTDGELTPAQLVEMAKEKGMDLIALSDHDTMQNVPEFRTLANAAGMQTIDALEISTGMEGYSVHLLGYGIQLDDPILSTLQERSNDRRHDVYFKRAALINQKYHMDVDAQALLEKAGEENPWFYFFEEVLKQPQAKDIEELQDYLPGGKRCDPAPVNFFWDKCQPGSDLYVPADLPDFLEMISRVHEAGGIAILAHPFNTFYQREDRLQAAIDAGLDGLEVYSNYHTPEQIAWYLEFAKAHNLLISCGSDFHGKHKPNIQMGDYHLHEDGSQYAAAILKALQK